MATTEKIELAAVVVTALVGALGWFQWWKDRAGNRRPVVVRGARPEADRLPDDRTGLVSSADDRSIVRTAEVFLVSRSDVPQDVVITDGSRVLWPLLGVRPSIRTRRVRLPAHAAGNARLMLISRNWPARARRYLVSVHGETIRGQRVRGRVWVRLSGYHWAEPPGIAG